MDKSSIRRRPRAVAWPLALVAIAACGGSQSPGTNAELAFVAHSTATTNEGRPFRMLVRTVELKTFLEESYGQVASMIMTPDESVLASAVIYPGERQSVSVTRPKQGLVAVYFLFTQPGEPWKLLIERADLTAVNLYLGPNSILEPGRSAP